MDNQFELAAEPRVAFGKGPNRRMRRAGQVPAVVYGAGRDPESITLDHNDLMTHLQHEAFHSHILKLKVGDAPQEVVLRDVQYHPYKRQVLHIDLLRVSATHTLRMTVPVHLVGEDTAPGVKLEDGEISRLMPEVEIECLPRDLPEYLEIDMSDMHVDSIVHLSEIKLPNGVSIPALALGEDHDLPVVSIHPKRVADAEEGEAAPAETTAAAPADDGDDGDDEPAGED